MTGNSTVKNIFLLAAICAVLSCPAHAADPLASASTDEELVQKNSAEELAKKLANPVAALISVPFQLNYDTDIGPDDTGDKWVLNIQPVIPVSISDDWNVISRTILPVVFQDEIFSGSGNQEGIGDIVQSLFFSPKQPTASGWVLGGGPVFLFPSGSDDLLTADKWGAGPTAVALKQMGAWTLGGLTNHIWSYAGDDDRADVNLTFLQPFLTYTTKTAISVTGMTESTYDWDAEQWSVPLSVVVTKVTKIGNQMVSFGGGLRYWADSPDGGPEGWGVRLVFTLMFPQ
jgi:hypothetical protein